MLAAQKNFRVCHLISFPPIYQAAIYYVHMTCMSAADFSSANVLLQWRPDLQNDFTGRPSGAVH